MTHEIPRVSIITPCYNVVRYLPETWKSIKRQSYENWEWIITDDGSTDGTKEWAEGLAGKYLGKIIFETGKHVNKGTAENRGLAVARGGIIMIMDGDDLWHRDKVKRQVEFLDQHPETSMTYSWIKEFWSEKKRTNTKPPNVWPRREVLENFTEHLLTIGNTFCTSSLAIRKEVFDKVGGFNDEIPAHDDFEFLLRASYHFKIKRTPGILVKYRITENSLTGKPNPEKRIKLYEAIISKKLDRGIGGKVYHATFQLQMAEFAMTGDLDESPRPYILKCLRYHPKAYSRWLILPLLILPRKWISSAYILMKRIQISLFSKSTRSHRFATAWAGQKKD